MGGCWGKGVRSRVCGAKPCHSVHRQRNDQESRSGAEKSSSPTGEGGKIARIIPTRSREQRHEDGIGIEKDRKGCNMKQTSRAPGPLHTQTHKSTCAAHLL